MNVIVRPGGEAVYLYDEAADLAALGRPDIRRASVVEWCRGRAGWAWYAHLGLVGGPTLGPFGKRSAALAAEREWLLENVLRQGKAVAG